MSNVNGLYIAGQQGPQNNDGKFYLSKLEGDTLSKSYDFPNIPGQSYGPSEVVNQKIMCQAIYNGELYVAGGGFVEGEVDYPYLAKLNNKTNQLSNNLLEEYIKKERPITVGYINAMTIYKEKLYFGAEYAIFYYDGKTFFPFSNFTYKGIDLTGDSYLTVNCMNVHNDELYIGGFFMFRSPSGTDPELQTLYVAKLESDGVTFSNNFTFIGVEKSIDNFPSINAMITYNGDLYAVGGGQGLPLYFAKLDDNNNTFGSNIIDTTNDSVFGPSAPPEGIKSLFAYKERIYLGFGPAILPHNQVYYDIKNKTFNKVLVDNSITDIMDMTIYENDLYGAGNLNGPGFVGKLDSDGKKFNSFGKNAPSNCSIQSIIAGNPDVKHASDGSGGGKKIYKKSKDLKLILGLSIGLGIPVLGVIIFIMYKYGLRNKLSN